MGKCCIVGVFEYELAYFRAVHILGLYVGSV
jgi:hypothetical protein